MGDLFQIFAQSSKKEWLDKVTQDLKGKDIESLSYHLSDQSVVSPFAHQDDIIEDICIPIPHYERIQLGVTMLVDDEVESNRMLLEALNEGVSYVHLILEKDRKIDFDQLFGNVMIDLIHLEITIEKNDKIAQDFLSYLCAHYKEEIVKKVFFSVKEASALVSQMNSLGAYKTSDIVGLQKFLSQGADFLELRPEPTVSTITIEASHDYIQSISFIRAVRLLWRNLCEAFERNIKYFPIIVKGTISEEVIEAVSYDNMIAFTQMKAAIVSAGVDVLITKPSDEKKNTNGTEFSRRISRNIFHLINEEAHMLKVQDPAAGSYLFDKLTVQIAEESWRIFIKERKNA